MNRKGFRTLVISTLAAHPWLVTNGITAIDWNGTQVDLEAAESAMRAAGVGSVLLVSQIIGAKPDVQTSRQHFLTREAQLIIAVRTNSGHATADSHDDVVDEVVLAIAGAPAANGAKPIQVLEERLIKDDSLIVTHIIIAARVHGGA